MNQKGSDKLPFFIIELNTNIFITTLMLVLTNNKR